MNTDSGTVLGVVGIHATIIGIVVAVLTAFIFFARGTIHEAETAVLQEAEKINDIPFIRSAYFPQDYSSPWVKSFAGAIQAKREELDAIRASEPQLSKLEVPSSVEDFQEAFRYLEFLANPLHALGRDEKEYELGNGKYIPRDLANRGEEIFVVLNMISQSEIFPESPFPSIHTYTTGMPRRVYLTNTREAEEWLLKVEAYVACMKGYRSIQGLIPGTTFITSLKGRDQGLIYYWESQPITKSKGHLDPDILMNDFQEQYGRVAKIAEATRYTLHKYKRISSGFPLPFLYFLLMFFFVVFISGVVVPLINPSIPKSIHLYFPLGSYVLLFLGLIVWLVKK